MYPRTLLATQARCRLMVTGVSPRPPRLCRAAPQPWGSWCLGLSLPRGRIRHVLWLNCPRSLSAQVCRLLRSLWMAAPPLGAPAAPLSFATLANRLRLGSVPAPRVLMEVSKRTGRTAEAQEAPPAPALQHSAAQPVSNPPHQPLLRPGLGRLLYEDAVRAGDEGPAWQALWW